MKDGMAQMVRLVVSIERFTGIVADLKHQEAKERTTAVDSNLKLGSNNREEKYLILQKGRLQMPLKQSQRGQ